MHCKSNANYGFGLHEVLFQNIAGALAAFDAAVLTSIIQK